MVIYAWLVTHAVWCFLRHQCHVHRDPGQLDKGYGLSKLLNARLTIPDGALDTSGDRHATVSLRNHPRWHKTTNKIHENVHKILQKYYMIKCARYTMTCMDYKTWKHFNASNSFWRQSQLFNVINIFNAKIDWFSFDNISHIFLSLRGSATGMKG